MGIIFINVRYSRECCKYKNISWEWSTVGFPPRGMLGRKVKDPIAIFLESGVGGIPVSSVGGGGVTGIMLQESDGGGSFLTYRHVPFFWHSVII